MTIDPRINDLPTSLSTPRGRNLPADELISKIKIGDILTYQIDATRDRYEVRGIVDNRVVMRRYSRRKQRWDYVIEHKSWLHYNAPYLWLISKRVKKETTVVTVNFTMYDTDRLRYCIQCFDGIEGVEWDRYDYAMDETHRHGRVADSKGDIEPIPDDELNGFRRMIDAAIHKERLKLG